MIHALGISPIILSTIDTNLLLFVPICVASTLLSWVTVRRTPEYAKGRKLNVISICLMAVLSFVLYHIFGVSVNLLKGILLTDLFLFASVSDFRIPKICDPEESS